MLRRVLWMGLYGAIGALATMIARRAASGIWRVATGEQPTREALMRGDATIEKSANQLDTLAESAAEKGGLRGKLADELADDAAFLRKLKPSLIVARAKRKGPKAQEPDTRSHAPGKPQLGPRPTGKRGPNPLVVAGIAFAAGTLLAKVIDWRSHAHPRR